MTTVAIDPGDYSIQTLIPQLNAALRGVVLSEAGNTTFMGQITAAPLSNPPEIKNIIKLTCPYPFVFDMLQSTMAESLGFHTYTQSMEASKNPLDHRYDTNYIPTPYNFTSDTNGLVFSVGTIRLTPNGYSAKSLTTVIANALTPFNITMDLIKEANGIGELTVFQLRSRNAFSIDLASSTANKVIGWTTSSSVAPFDPVTSLYSVTLSTALAPITNKQIYHSVDLDPSVTLGVTETLFEGPRGVIERVAIPINTIVTQSFTVVKERTYLSGVLGAFVGVGTVQWSISPDFGGQPSSRTIARGTIIVLNSDGTLDDSNDVPSSVLLERGRYWISFGVSSSASVASLLYNDIANPNELLKYRGPTTNNQWTDIKIGDVNATASIRIVTSDEYHTLIGPGTYNFIGERYIILRCPEIEDSSYRSLATTNNFLGLAMFRLGTVGLSDNKVSHVRVPTRKFHPVGKVPKLSFRFETIHGQPYDFKGVNHTLTLVMHYLVPNSDTQFKRSIINPNYTGNFLDYMMHQESHEGDSDDQDEAYNRDAIMNYRIQEARHMPDAVQRLDREALFRARIEEKDV
jgi:hypothetical protein